MREIATKLLSLKDSPEAFLEAQQVLYELRPFSKNGQIPEELDFYKAGDKPPETKLLTDKPPRVLNLGSGPDEARQFAHAINLDLSRIGSPDVVSDVATLPFPTDSMTAIHASHVLEHSIPEQIPAVIKEWRRVLHPSGVLRVAVPDAEVTLKEIIEGVTAKGEVAVDFENGTAPLTQIYGLASENPDTDERWRHHILFSNALLWWYLEEGGFADVVEYQEKDSLSFASGVKSDENNHYSMRMEARARISPHSRSEAIDADSYREREDCFIPEKDLSIIVPVHQEKQNLPQFLSHLSQIIQQAPLAKKETIFVVNGTTDGSEKIIEEFISQRPELDTKIIHSDKGILNAFCEGIKARKLDGFVCKVDVDTEPHVYSLGVMYMYLSENDYQVVYAEPFPSEPVGFYNVGEHYEDFRTQREFIHGRFSMYRQNPFDLFDEKMIRDTGALVEDMVLSSCYAYYCGIDSMAPAPGAVVKSCSPKSFEQLAHQRTRILKEVRRVNRAFPHFRILKKALSRQSLRKIDEEDDTTTYLQREYYYHLNRALSFLAKLEGEEGEDDWSFRSNEVLKES